MSGVGASSVSAEFEGRATADAELERRIWATQQDALSEPVMTGIWATWAASMLVAGLVYWVHPPLRTDALGWGLAACALAVTHAFAWRWYLRQAWSLEKKERFLIGMVVPHAVMLSLQSILLASHGVREVSMFLMCMISGLSCGGVSLLAPRKPVYRTMMIPPLLAQSGMFFWLGAQGLATAFHVMLGLAMLTLLVAVLVFLNTQADFVTRGIRLGFENAALVERLREQTLAAEAANAAKTKFLAAASHDLRQPVHALGLFIEVLSSTQLDERQQRILGHIQAASSASREMLNTLLDFSRIEAGVMQAHAQPTPLAPLLLALQEEFGPQADAKNIVYRSRDTSGVAECDPALTSLVLRNFVSNAIRYTQAGGVLVAVRRRGQRGEHLVVQAWDTGIGIEPEQQEAVFEEFHQLGNPERDRQKGLGLGLAIARGLAQTMGTKITLNSKPGRGSVFSLWLPASTVPAAGFATRSGGWSASALQATEPAPQREASAALKKKPLGSKLQGMQVHKLHGLQVLVVDDEELVRQSMQALLEGWGCEVRTAEGLAEALQCVGTQDARRFEPDMVLTDYRLREGITGGQVIAALRSELGSQLPAIVITGDTAPDRIREAASLDATLLHKPLNIAALERAMLSLCASPVAFE
jgi:two-component system, sensor histidine kinase